MPFLRREDGITTLACFVHNAFPQPDDSHLLVESFTNIVSQIRSIRRTKVRGYPLAGDNLVNIDITYEDDVLMQSFDFYVFGYKNRLLNGVWELRVEDTPKKRRNQSAYKIRIKDSLAIGVDESYTDLLSLDLSYWCVTQAIEELVKIDDPRHKNCFQTRKNLFKIILMLVESARSNWIEDFYRVVIENQSMNVPCEPWICDVVSNWSKASKIAQDCEGEVVLDEFETKLKLTRNIKVVLSRPRLCRDMINTLCLV